MQSLPHDRRRRRRVVPAGRQGRSEPRYGDDLVAAGEAGLVWDEANMAEYLVNPTDFLRTTLDDKKARSKMSFRMRKGGEDVAAYLATFSPEAEAEAEADAPMAKDAETEKTE